MAVLYITEFADIGISHSNGPMQIAKTPPVFEQAIPIAASSVQSAALHSNTVFVRLCADSVCSIAFGTNPTATANSMRLPANVPEYFAVTVSPRYIAVITNT